MRPLTRRTLLLGALTAGCAAPPAPTVRTTTTTPAVPAEPVQVRRALSQARGTDVRMVVVTPGGVPAGDLPVCLVLHGSGDSADLLLDLGAPAVLAGASTPFALVAVDGGDSYWRAVGHDDPAAMLSDELPRWLARAGLATTPFAVVGFAEAAVATVERVRRSAPLAAALVDPIIPTEWDSARLTGVFPTEESWAAVDPLRHAGQLGTTALAVWSGSEADFAERAGADLRPLEPGGHEAWRRVLPDVVAFLGGHAGAVRGGY